MIYLLNFWNNISALRARIVGWVLTCGIVLLSVTMVSAFEFDDVIRMFEKDTDRISPLRMVERYKSIIKHTSNMEIKNDIKITVKIRGEAKQDFYESHLKRLHSFDELESNVIGYESFLKRLKLIEQDSSLGDLLESYYLNVAGLYIPEKKELIIVKGVNRKKMSATLLHELFHAAQDSTVDIERLYVTHPNSMDTSLALSSLIEGQAVALDILVMVKKEIADRSVEDALREMTQFYKKSLEEYEFDSIFESIQSFPYSLGFIFVVKQYTDGKKSDFQSMFEQIPVSTEQVLHYDKFVEKEKPESTVLETQIGAFEPSWKRLYVTTLGEYYIQVIFNSTMKDNVELNKKAASGWGGDYISVFEANDKRFFVWDTLWDSEADAREFFERYEAFSRLRFDVSALSGTNSFDIVYPKKNPHLFMNIEGTRVLIIEGEVTEGMIQQIVQDLKVSNG